MTTRLPAPRLLLAAAAATFAFAVAPATAHALCFGESPTITGTAAGETIPGTPGDDVIEAGDGDDVVDGGGGADLICGEGGDDTINGQAGSDQLDGGPHTVADTVTFVGSASGVTADLFLETATVGAETDSIEGFENLTGTATFDNLTGDDGPNTIRGLGAADGLTGRGGDDVLDDASDNLSIIDEAKYPGATGGITADLLAGTVSGPGVGTDTLIGVPGVEGSSFDDTLAGNEGQNSLFGRGGNDLLEPRGGGSDYADGGSDVDTVSYASEATGGVVVDMTDDTPPNVTTPDGGESAFFVENVIGTDFDDEITGGPGDNVIDARGLNDDLVGGGGSDTASFAALAQGVNASLVTGVATGQGADDLVGFENLTGSSAADTLGGDDSPNVLSGLAGADHLTGGHEADILALGAGADVVTANDGFADTIDCTGGGPDSGTVDTSPPETYIACNADSDALVDFLDTCPGQAASTSNGCPPVFSPRPGPTGRRAAALKACKKKAKKKGWSKKRLKKCRRGAQRLPV